ncbi:MAG: hypothetical protein HY665_01595 [Chloroflexi bacterium]|nr:hypothetical protein [Chloroflexota bacterium]
MGLGFFKKNDTVGVIIITVSCCTPGAVVFEEEARRVVDQAISETGVTAQVKMVPATTAFFGEATRGVMAKLMADANQGQLKIPPIMIDGKAAFYGVPKIEEMKTALLRAAEARKMKEENTREPEPKSSNIA